MRAGRLLVWQSGALLAMILAFSLALPWKLAAIAFAVAALVLGVLVFVAARKARRAALARAAAGSGIGLALLGGLVAGLPLLAWEQTAQLEQCSASALTERARQACEAEFTRQVEELTGVAQLGR